MHASRLALTTAIAGLAALCFGVFVAPYLIPSSSPLLSASSLSGFNNTVAYAAYVVFSCATAAALVRWSRPSSRSLPIAVDGPLFLTPPLEVVAVIGAQAALFAVVQVVKGFVLAEALYFEDAAYRVTAGAVPFVDFNFFYGPLMLYPTVLLARIGSVETAYAIAYIATWVAGLYFLYCVIGQFVQDRWARTVWFGFFAFGLFSPILGLNYTFMRFTLPLLAVMAAWRAHLSASGSQHAVAAALMALALLCSPDMGLVAAAGVGIVGLCAAWATPAAARGRVLVQFGLVGGAALLVSAGALLLIDGTTGPLVAYLRPIATFSAGAWNTPIDPSLPVLTLLGLTLFVLVRLAGAWRRGDIVGHAPLLAGYVAVLLAMQRASFGKADVIHVAYSGLPIFIVAAGAAGTGAPGRGRQFALAALLCVGVVLPLQAYHAMLFVPSFVPSLSAHAADPKASPPAGVPVTKAQIQAGLTRAVEQFGADRTYYMHRLEYYRLPIYERYRLKPFLYHPSLTSAFTPEDIEDVIRALRTSGAIVLARKADLEVAAPPRLLETRWWCYAGSLPLPGSQVYNLTLQFQDRLERPLVQFLLSEYDRTYDDGGVVGLVLRPSAAARADAVQ